MKNLGKRIVVILLALSMVLSSVSAIVVNVSAADVTTTESVETEALAISKLVGTCGTNALWEYDLENKTLTITGTGEVTKLDNEFVQVNAEKLIIGEGITVIADGVFYGYNITDVQFPETLTVIGEYSFYNCQNLREVIIPKNVGYIQMGAFVECYHLDKFTILGNVKTDGTVFDCAPKVLELAGKMTKLGQVLLNGEDGTIVKEIKLINDNPYYKWEGNYLLNADGTKLLYYLGFPEGIVEIPESVISIGSYAFYYKSIEEIVFNEKLENIGMRAFYRCGLKDIILPTHLKKIGKEAFSRNDMKTVKFNRTIEKIGEEAFAGDNNIKKVKFYNNPKIVKGAFEKNVKIKYGKKAKMKGSFAFADYILDTDVDLYYVMLRINKIDGAEGYQVKIYQPSINNKVLMNTTKRLVLKKTDFLLDIYEDEKWGTQLEQSDPIYAKVRPYKLVDGKKIYGEWSSKAKLDGYPNFFKYTKKDIK